MKNAFYSKNLRFLETTQMLILTRIRVGIMKEMGYVVIPFGRRK